MVQSFGDAPAALVGALLGCWPRSCSAGCSARGMLRLDLRRFFFWTGAFLIIVRRGVLAYAVHDLQEGGALPGPFGALAPTTGDRRGRCRHRRLPVRWAFDVTAQIPPGSPLAACCRRRSGSCRR
jgi:high-affinity iron transporter